MARKNKPKVIALDYDDTLVNFQGLLCDIHNRLYDTCVYPSDFTEYDIKKLEVTDARGTHVKGIDIYETFKKYEGIGLYSALKPLDGARRALHLIHKLGYKIIIVTARSEEYRDQTIFNLLHQNLDYDEIHFCPSSEKAKTIRRLSKEYNIVAFVDDKAATCADVAENTNVNTVYMVDQAHNRSFESDDIKRIDSVFELIRDLRDISEG